jgi:hypothetical protein
MPSLLKPISWQRVITFVSTGESMARSSPQSGGCKQGSITCCIFWSRAAFPMLSSR